jgi:hypothetical protein
MKKLLLILLALCCIGWAFGWQSDQSVNNLGVNGKVYTYQRSNYGMSLDSATCGASNSAVLTPRSTDTAGSITFGTGTITSCKVTFDSVYVNAPVCMDVRMSSKISSIDTVNVTTDTTGMFFQANTSFAGEQYGWICVGQQ